MFSVEALNPEDELDARLIALFSEAKKLQEVARKKPEYQARLKAMFVEALGSPLGHGLWTLIQNKLLGQ